MEELITKIETANSVTYLELFEFNGFNPPKFWFGENVKWGDCIGTILGLEWRDGIKALPCGDSQKFGWWYKVCLNGRHSLMGFHEDSLEISDLPLSGRSPPGGDAMS